MADVTPECLRIVTVDDVYAAAVGAAARRQHHEDPRALGRRRCRGRPRAPRGGGRARAVGRGAVERPRRGGHPLSLGGEPDRERAGRDRRSGHGLDQGVGPPAAARRPQLPRAVRVEGRLALVVRRAVPPPLDGRAAPRARDRDPCTGSSTAEAPDEVETLGLSPEDTLLVERTCRRARRPVPRPAPAHRLSRRAQASRPWCAPAALERGQGAGSPRPRPARRAASRPVREDRRPPSLFLSHAAFWRARAEGRTAVDRVRALLRPPDPRRGGERPRGRSWSRSGRGGVPPARRAGTGCAEWLRLRGDGGTRTST